MPTLGLLSRNTRSPVTIRYLPLKRLPLSARGKLARAKRPAANKSFPAARFQPLGRSDDRRLLIRLETVVVIFQVFAVSEGYNVPTTGGAEAIENGVSIALPAGARYPPGWRRAGAKPVCGSD